MPLGRCGYCSEQQAKSFMTHQHCLVLFWEQTSKFSRLALSETCWSVWNDVNSTDEYNTTAESINVT